MVNKMSEPLVSVLIPCYNVEKYVVESVNSIINQTYGNLEIILINDCSTDNTKFYLESLAQTDKRIKVYTNETNLKLITTLNSGITYCSGKYIARMDADDISLPTRIEKQVRFLENNPDYDIVSTMFYTFRDRSKRKDLYKNPTKYEDLQAYLLFKSGICHPASMIRKTLFTDIGLRFESEYLHVEDYALWSKAIYCTKIANIDEALLLYRVHASQVSTKNEILQLENKKEVFKIHIERLDLPSSNEYLEIYASVAEAVPIYSSLEYIDECEALMISLVEKNKKERFCSQVYLERMLSLHWVRLCANSRLGLKVLSKCFSSSLFNKSNYQFSDYIILFIKCLFKIKYKESFVYKIIFR